MSFPTNRADKCGDSFSRAWYLYMYRRVPSVTPSGHVVKVGLSLPSVPSFVPSIAIPRLSEVLSELVWRIVGGTVSVDLAIDYLASDKPFQHRLGPRGEEGSEGDEEGRENEQGEKGEGGKGEEKTAAETSPLLEALCDTIWGVDAMASHSHIPWMFMLVVLLAAKLMRAAAQRRNLIVSACVAQLGVRVKPQSVMISFVPGFYSRVYLFSSRPGRNPQHTDPDPCRPACLHLPVYNMSLFSFYHVEASKW